MLKIKGKYDNFNTKLVTHDSEYRRNVKTLDDVDEFGIVLILRLPCSFKSTGYTPLSTLELNSLFQGIKAVFILPTS